MELNKNLCIFYKKKSGKRHINPEEEAEMEFIDTVKIDKVVLDQTIEQNWQEHAGCWPLI